MRILLCIDAPPDPNGGASGTAVQTALALRGLGHEVDCVWADDLPHRIRHWNLHYLAELPWGLRRAVADRCRGRHYDVIQVHQPYSWLAARDHRRSGRRGVFITQTQGWEPRVTSALQPWRRRFGIPEWRFPRGLVGRPMRFVIERLYPKWAAANSHGVVTSCSEDAEYIRVEYGLSSERVVTIPMGVADTFLRPLASSMDYARAKSVLYVGQFAFFKGIHVLAAVYSRLARLDEHIRLGWSCPPERQDEARSMLDPDARWRVTFHSPVPQDDLVALYDRYGVFLFPTLAEGFGKVFLEAMARGMVVVASHAAGMRDVICNGVDGWTVPPGDIEAFTSRVLEATTSLELSGRISIAASAKARLHTWERVARESERFYHALLGLQA